MPIIHVKYVGPLYLATLVKEEIIKSQSTNIGELINEIIRRHPETSKILLKIKDGKSIPPVLIAVDGKIVPPSQIENVKLKEHMKVTFTLPSAGG